MSSGYEEVESFLRNRETISLRPNKKKTVFPRECAENQQSCWLTYGRKRERRDWLGKCFLLCPLGAPQCVLIQWGLLSPAVPSPETSLVSLSLSQMCLTMVPCFNPRPVVIPQNPLWKAGLLWDLLASSGCILVMTPSWRGLQVGVPHTELNGRAQPWRFIMF